MSLIIIASIIAVEALAIIAFILLLEIGIAAFLKLGSENPGALFKRVES